MNIVFVMSDTFRRDHLTCYDSPPWGWDIHAPSISRLAMQSVVFDRFYQGSFPTIPTVHDILTGCHCFHGAGPGFRTDATAQARLAEAGYVSMLITDAHNYPTPGLGIQCGFDGFEFIRGQQGDAYRTAPREVTLPCNPDKVRECDKLLVPHLRNTAGRVHEREWFAPRVFQTAIDWLEANHDQHEGFFLYVHAFDVHEPWDPPRYYVDRYDPDYQGQEVILPRYDRSGYLTEAELNHCRALYAGEIGLVDRWFGLLLDRIDQLGLAGDTAVIFTADHGFYLGDQGYVGKHTVLEPARGWPLYDVIGHCPLLLRVPGGQPGRSDALCQHVDLMPTILQLAGVDLPDDIHGRSLMPVLRGHADSVRDLAINSGHLPAQPEARAYSTVTDGDHTLVYAGAEAPAELYHLPTDPTQEDDLIRARPDVARNLHARHLEVLEQIGTPQDRLELRRYPAVPFG